jgi:hypothetical protein
LNIRPGTMATGAEDDLDDYLRRKSEGRIE